MKNFIGINWGNVSDSMYISVINSDGQEVYREVYSGHEFASQRNRLVELCNQFNATVILAENNSIGSVNIEALQQEGLPVRGITITKKSKDAVLSELMSAMKNGKLKLMKPIRFEYGIPEMDEVTLAIAYSLWAQQHYGGDSISFA